MVRQTVTEADMCRDRKVGQTGILADRYKVRELQSQTGTETDR